MYCALGVVSTRSVRPCSTIRLVRTHPGLAGRYRTNGLPTAVEGSLGIAHQGVVGRDLRRQDGNNHNDSDGQQRSAVYY